MDFLMEQGLSSWRTLSVSIKHYTEEQLREMLTHELKHGKRKVVMKRLHQRLGVLRQAREWDTILKETGRA